MKVTKKSNKKTKYAHITENPLEPNFSNSVILPLTLLEEASSRWSSGRMWVMMSMARSAWNLRDKHSGRPKRGLQIRLGNKWDPTQDKHFQESVSLKKVVLKVIHCKSESRTQRSQCYTSSNESITHWKLQKHLQSAEAAHCRVSHGLVLHLTYFNGCSMKSLSLEDLLYSQGIVKFPRAVLVHVWRVGQVFVGCGYVNVFPSKHRLSNVQCCLQFNHREGTSVKHRRPQKVLGLFHFTHNLPVLPTVTIRLHVRTETQLWSPNIHSFCVEVQIRTRLWNYSQSFDCSQEHRGLNYCETHPTVGCLAKLSNWIMARRWQWTQSFSAQMGPMEE